MLKTTFTLLLSLLGFFLLAQYSPDSDTKMKNEKSGNESVIVSPEISGTSHSFDKKSIRNTLEWTIEATYEIPQNASGLAWDGTNLYCGIYGVDGDRIFQIDPETGDYELLFSAPIEDAYGLTYDGEFLWSVSQEGSSSDPAQAVAFDFDGNEAGQFELQAHYMSGIAYDDGDFWSAAYYDPDGHLYKTDDEGNVLNDFPAPDNQPWDLTVEGENLWMADTWGNAIYQIDKATGELIASFPSEGEGPAGVTWDGQYLWYTDEGEGESSWLYKVNLSGSGSPVVDIPVASHNYGLVNVDDNETWDMTVGNTGAVDLEIEGLEINHPEISSATSFPVTVPPGEEITIALTFAPADFGELDHAIYVLSNDPMNSEAEVSLSGNGVFEGPSAEFSSSSHNYGNIREKATERWTIEIENQGDEILQINSADISEEVFYMDDVEFPVEIPVLGTGELSFWFFPQEVELYEDDVILTSNDPLNSTTSIHLEGSGEPAPGEMGAELWHHYITEGFDNTAVAFEYLPDLNDDGKYEVVVASEDNYIRCLNGNADDPADVLWETEIYSGNLYHQNSMMRTADLDGDLFDDIAVGTTGGDRSVRVLSGKDGEMVWKFDTDMYGGGGWVYQVFAKFDYNDDGVPDVLAAVGDDADDTGPKRVFCLDGTNGDLIWDKYTGGTAYSVIGVSDFTGDGVADVIAGATNESESQGSVKGLSGADGDEVWSFTTPGTSVWALSYLSDITGDGVSDVIAGDFSGNYFLVDATDGEILEEGGLGSSLILRFENAGSLNDDSYSDIVAAHSGTMMSAIDGNSGDFIWTSALEDKCWNVRMMNDVDGDDTPDVAVGTLYQNNYVYILSGADGTEIMKKAYTEPIDGLGIIPDVTGDMSYEVIAGGREGNVRCFSGGILLTTEAPAYAAASEISHSAAPNPFDQSLVIKYELPQPASVRIQIRTLDGRIVKTLRNKFVSPKNAIEWDGRDATGYEMPAGVYLYTITSGNESVSGKILKN